jgi:hypothetical protein
VSALERARFRGVSRVERALRMVWITFLEEVVAAVVEALLAAVGSDEAGEGGDGGGEEDGEFDHFGSGVFVCFGDWMGEVGSLLIGFEWFG